MEGKGKFYISLQEATQLMGKAEDTWRTESQRRQKRAAEGGVRGVRVDKSKLEKLAEQIELSSPPDIFH